MRIDGPIELRRGTVAREKGISGRFPDFLRPMRMGSRVADTILDLKCFGPIALLSESEQQTLARAASYRRLCRGQLLVGEGDQEDFAYAVVSGGIKLIKSLRDGRTQMTGYLLPGDFLGLPLHGTYPFSVEAVCNVVLYQCPIHTLRGLFERHPDLQMQLIKASYDGLAAAYDHMLLLGRKTVIERVCSFLVSLLERVEGIIGPTDTMVLPFRRGEIADYLGVTIETVSRAFSKLQRDGLISIGRSDEIGIESRQGLVAIAEGGRARRKPHHNGHEHVSAAE